MRLAIALPDRPARSHCPPPAAAVAQVFDGPPATVAELAAVEEDLTAGAMQADVVATNQRPLELQLLQVRRRRCRHRRCSPLLPPLFAGDGVDSTLANMTAFIQNTHNSSLPVPHGTQTRTQLCSRGCATPHIWLGGCLAAWLPGWLPAGQCGGQVGAAAG